MCDIKLREISIRLPDWMEAFCAAAPGLKSSVDQRMEWVISLAAENVRRKTGGPFAAAVFESKTSRLVSAGVNLVTASNCSIAHAEIIAISLAQQALASFDLGKCEQGPYELFTSAEPCAMCLGAIPWSGVGKVVCAARDEDVRKIGFDEGAKPADWVVQMAKRGITVVSGLCRNKAIEVLQAYSDSGGSIYNSGD